MYQCKTGHLNEVQTHRNYQQNGKQMDMTLVWKVVSSDMMIIMNAKTGQLNDFQANTWGLTVFQSIRFGITEPIVAASS